MPINILDSSIYNKISAGEVVENPASVVKELVENSIDAGAYNITISIENGGLKNITIIDDGIGITKDDLPKTILPHATSKLSEINDLFSISTLGFRGEALASISAVSNLVITSKHIESEIGNRLTLKNDLIKIEPCAYNLGTSISVSDLFYNTPARLKFLKTPKALEASVTSTVENLIITNHDRVIKYYADGKLKLSSGGTGLLDALSEIYSTELTSQLIHIENTYNDVTVRGYISSPLLFKSTKSYQTIFVNGRVITDTGITGTILNAYQKRLMNRCYPVFALEILLPFDNVDINVHPNKKEVRFSDGKKVYSIVYKTISMALEKFDYDRLLKFGDTSQKAPIIQEEIGGNIQKTQIDDQEKLKDCSVTQSDLYSISSTSKERDKNNLENTGDKSAINPKLDIFFAKSLPKENDYNPILNKIPNRPELSKPNFLNDYNSLDLLENTVAALAKNDTKNVLSTAISQISFEEKLGPDSASYNITETEDNLHNPDCRIIGQLFGTYLLVEVQADMIFIDQHAMHEKILYNQFFKDLGDNRLDVQSLLIPFISESNNLDTESLDILVDNLSKLGFVCSSFYDNSIKIDAVPSIFLDIDLSMFWRDLIMDIKVNSLKDFRVLQEKVASKACKCAIKGHSFFEKDKQELLVDYFLKNMQSNCPHGRPAFVTLSKYEIEKLFRRKL